FGTTSPSTTPTTSPFRSGYSRSWSVGRPTTFRTRMRAGPGKRSREGSSPAMPANLTIRPEAEHDIDLGYAWYEAQHTGLGQRFLNAVEACLQAICRMPKAARVIRGSYRRAVVRGFPYLVIYDYDEPNDTVIVYVVFHTSQDPARWQQRLP